MGKWPRRRDRGSTWAQKCHITIPRLTQLPTLLNIQSVYSRGHNLTCLREKRMLPGDKLINRKPFFYGGAALGP